MADDKQPEPSAVTYADVQKAYDDPGAAAAAWREIGEVTGAGHVPPGEYATIETTHLTKAKADKVGKLLNPKVEEQKATNANEAESTSKPKAGGSK